MHFVIPFITPEKAISYINELDSAKSIGIDGLGHRNIKLAVQCIYHHPLQP